MKKSNFSVVSDENPKLFIQTWKFRSHKLFEITHLLLDYLIARAKVGESHQMRPSLSLILFLAGCGIIVEKPRL